MVWRMGVLKSANIQDSTPNTQWHSQDIRVFWRTDENWRRSGREFKLPVVVGHADGTVFQPLDEFTSSLAVDVAIVNDNAAVGSAGNGAVGVFFVVENVGATVNDDASFQDFRIRRREAMKPDCLANYVRVIVFTSLHGTQGTAL